MSAACVPNGDLPFGWDEMPGWNPAGIRLESGLPFIHVLEGFWHGSGG
jgi:hypothetical protein